MKSIQKLTVLVLVFVSYSLNATTYYVSTTGSDANPGTVGSPFRTLTQAVSVGLSGDVISIEAGTWGAGITDDNITITVSNLTITGAGAGTTIFDGDAMSDGLGERFITISGTGTNVIISGLTIKDMDVSGNGAGINITTSGSVTLQDIIFDNCDLKATGNLGGGVYVSSSSSVTIDRCIFRNNNTFNSSSSYATCVYTAGTTTVQNSLFYDNNTNYSSGSLSSGHIHNVTGTLSIYNCTVTENTATSGYSGDIYVQSGTVIAKNCILYNNPGTDNLYNSAGTASLTYSLYDDGHGGAVTNNNNITNSDVNPLFFDASSNDFSISAHSPCRDKGTETGTPSLDIDSKTRGSGGTSTGSTYDIGCYENTCSAGTYYVNDAVDDGTELWATSATGNDGNGGTTGAPFLTLEYALRKCGCAGNTIRIDAGTYSDDNLILSTDATSSVLTIQGAGSSLTIFDCDIDAVTTERFMTLNVDADNISISDMTIKDSDISGNGAGFNLTTTGSITLQDLIIDNCDLAATGNLGGGVYVSTTSSATIDRCIFRNNNTFNSSSSYATCIYTAGTTTVQNSLFYDNNTNYSTSSLSSGHIHNATGTLSIYNCTVTENTATSGYSGDIYVQSGTVIAKNCILYNNPGTDNLYNAAGTASLTYSLYDDGHGGTVTNNNNITNSDVNPLFFDASSNDFSISAHSPCRDKGTETGTPSLDIDSKTRGSDGTSTGSTYDIGCYENTCSAGTYYVNDAVDDGTELWATAATGNNANAGTIGAPFLTLDYALRKCGCPGNTIKVDAGTYSDDNLFLSTDATASALTITGAGKTLTIFDCDVDAVTTERFMTINIDADNISITDMTIKDADISGNGSGFNLTTIGSITLQDLIIDNCDLAATGNLGGGVYVSTTSSATIDRCIFRNNNTHNSSSSYGTCLYTAGITTMQNCLLYDNNTNYSTGSLSSGNIHNATGTLNVYNCTVTENTATNGYAADIYVQSGTVTAKNCILYNNPGTDNLYNAAGTASLTYSLYDDGHGGTVTNNNNITNSDADPLFYNASTDDFRISANSICRDKGTETSTPNVDIDELDRGTNGVYSGTTYDIGCYENSCTSGIYYVNDNSTSGDIWCSAVGNDANDGTFALPYASLSKALKECGCPGNTIRVEAGTYSEDNFVLSTEATSSAFTIQGAGKILTIFDCDIDAVTTERFMTFNTDADNIFITDMTIKDTDVSGNGAGFNLTTTGTITLQDLIIDNCDLLATGNLGGGVYVSSTSTAIIDRCIFRNNNTFNSSSSYATCLYTAGITTVQNSLFYDNNTNYSSGSLSSGHIHNATGTLNVYNCTITENTATSGYAADIYVQSGTVTAKNCILYNNPGTDNLYNSAGSASLTYSLYDDGYGGTVTNNNNLTTTDVNPIFMDTSSDDFQISAISPARNSGTSGGGIPLKDLYEVDRSNSVSHTDSGYDMGCYENVCNPGTYYVNDNSSSGDVWVGALGNDSNTGGVSDPFLTLTKALKVCGCSSNSVKIDAGTYSDDNISMSASNFTIQGAANNLTILDCDLDGNTTERFMTINVNATSFKISDVTIKDTDISGNGAGINITSSGLVTLQDIIFDNCDLSATGNLGGAVYVSSNSIATIDRCIFRNNNTFNSSSSYATCLYTAGVTTVQNSLFYDNNTNYSSGSLSSGHIHNATGTLNVYNCTITENTATNGYAADVYVQSGTVSVKNCILYNNPGTDNLYNAAGTASLAYSLYDDGYGGTVTNNNNNTGSSPSFTNAATNDFTIGSGSPCENTGTSTSMPTYDLLQATRPYGGSHDMGCYEYAPVFYWVGGSGNWVADAATHWATSSGGAGMHGSAPTSVDNVIFDVNSTGTITVDASASCSNLTSTGSTAILAGSSELNVYGSLTIGSGFTWSKTGDLIFKSTSTGNEIQTNAVTLSSDLNFNGVGGEWTMMDGITTSGNLILTAGTLLATSNDISLPGIWTSSGGVFSPGTGTVKFTGNSTTIAGTDASENFYNLTLNKTAGQNLSCGGSILTLSIGNNFTQTSGDFTAPATFTVGADFTLTSGTYTANSNLTVGGDMLLTAGTYTASANPATISGSFTNNGATFSAGTSTYTLNGSGYNINGSSNSTFYNLTLSGAYTMSTSTVVENILDLGAKLTLDDCILTIGTTSTNGSITGYSSANYIVASDIGGFIGYLKRYVNSNTSYICPIGDIDDYTPLTFTLNSNSGLASASITTYSDIHAITGTSTNFGSYDRRFWSLTQSGITTPNYDVDLVYADGDVFGTEANYLPIKYSGGIWYQPTGASYGSFTEEGTSASVTVGTNTLNWTGLSTFSLFGGAGDYVSPLPIQLLYFNAELMGEDVLLSWETASERNNDYFTVEKTLDGSDYEIIGITDGAGNSISPRLYSMYDFNIAKVINYYRLKQTDYDGNSTFSKLVSVDNRSDKNEKEIIGVYNLIGQEINEYYKGLVIIVYSDGSSVKMIQE